MEQMKWETDMIREERYDAVIHLETTAIGAEEYYTLQNNECRRETPEEAAALDEKIKQVPRRAVRNPRRLAWLSRIIGSYSAVTPK